jgi:hypothetical protein
LTSCGKDDRASCDSLVLLSLEEFGNCESEARKRWFGNKTLSRCHFRYASREFLSGKRPGKAGYSRVLLISFRHRLTIVLSASCLFEEKRKKGSASTKTYHQRAYLAA